MVSCFLSATVPVFNCRERTFLVTRPSIEMALGYVWQNFCLSEGVCVLLLKLVLFGEN